MSIRYAGSRFARCDSELKCNVRIESNRKAPQTNRLSLGVLDMDGGSFLALTLSFTVAHLRKHVSYADGMAHRSKLAYVTLSRTLFCGKYVVNLESFKRFLK